MNTDHMPVIVDMIQSTQKLADLVEQLAAQVHGAGSANARAVTTALQTHRDAMTKARQHFAKWV